MSFPLTGIRPAITRPHAGHVPLGLALMIISFRAGIVRAYECGTTKPAAHDRAVGKKVQVSGGGSGI